MKASDWIDRAKAQRGWPSDYRAAKEIGIKPNTISMYRTRGGTLDDECALKLAAILDIPAAALIIDQAAERSKNPEVRAILQEEARRLYIMSSFEETKIAPQPPLSGTPAQRNPCT